MVAKPAPGTGAKAPTAESKSDGARALPAVSTIVWLLEWDTSADAVEFQEAVKTGLDRISGALVTLGDRKSVILIGVPTEKHQAVAKEVNERWQAKKTSPN